MEGATRKFDSPYWHGGAARHVKDTGSGTLGWLGFVTVQKECGLTVLAARDALRDRRQRARKVRRECGGGKSPAGSDAGMESLAESPAESTAESTARATNAANVWLGLQHKGCKGVAGSADESAARRVAERAFHRSCFMHLLEEVLPCAPAVSQGVCTGGDVGARCALYIYCTALAMRSAFVLGGTLVLRAVVVVLCGLALKVYAEVEGTPLVLWATSGDGYHHWGGHQLLLCEPREMRFLC
ncbi:hypothetical protein CYMTET_19068 [Cymbomonas tetramitiformis]|uniref:Uncharacterized protein n=1 Tax=Cymbomonas tetramitiformis TaxID=36881 RepID=A0AAE0G6Q8_9CHLO|nr:hypothetical protein CYMTET_19068 [Cymbomonas tetramitiformis]